MATRRRGKSRGRVPPPTPQEVERQRAFILGQARQNLLLSFPDLPSEDIEELASLRGDRGVYVLEIEITLQYDDKPPALATVTIAGRGDDLLERVLYYERMGHELHEVQKYKTLRDDWPDELDGSVRPTWTGELWTTEDGGFIEGQGDPRERPPRKPGRRKKPRRPYETEEQKQKRLARNRQRDKRETEFEKSLQGLTPQQARRKDRARKKRQDAQRSRKK